MKAPSFVAQTCRCVQQKLANDLQTGVLMSLTLAGLVLWTQSKAADATLNTIRRPRRTGVMLKILDDCSPLNSRLLLLDVCS